MASLAVVLAAGVGWPVRGLDWSAAAQAQTSGGQGADATPLLDAAREALGGSQKLAAVKSFVATGRTRQIRGNNLVPIEFEILCELPDKYVRRDEVPAQETGLTSSGFNGDGLIQVPPPPEPPPQLAKPPGGVAPASTAPPQSGATPPAAAAKPPANAGAPPRPVSPPAQGAPVTGSGIQQGPPADPTKMKVNLPAPPDPRKARVTSIKQDFARLTLGMFAASFSGYPLTFVKNGQAEAPQGTADIIDVKGAGNFAVRLFINSQTHLPIMLSWTMPATNVVMRVPGMPPPQNIAPGAIVIDAPAPPAANAPKEEVDKYAKEIQDLRKKAMAGAKPVEYRLYYADYRDVGNGLKFPFRLRRAIAGETVEETNFDQFRINPRIDPRRFQALK